MIKCTKPFICNDTIFSASLLNVMLFLHQTFSLNTPSLNSKVLAQSSIHLLLWLPTLTLTFHSQLAIYQLLAGKVASLQKLSFSFYLVNSESDISLYLPVDHTTLKCFYYFSVYSILSFWFKTIFLDSYLDSCLLFLNLASCSIWILSLNFPGL